MNQEELVSRMDRLSEGNLPLLETVELFVYLLNTPQTLSRMSQSMQRNALMFAGTDFILADPITGEHRVNRLAVEIELLTQARLGFDEREEASQF